LMFSIIDAVIPDNNWSVNEEFYTAALNVKKIDMCKNTGDLPGKYCPATVKSWFIPGVSPIKVSNIYRAVPINKKTGLRACWYDPKETELKVYEFWPSDFLNIFRQAGISLKSPPPYSSDCSLNQKSASGQHPVILSPQSTLEYVIRSDSETGNQVPLSAVVDPDAEKLFWFINDSFIGTAKAGNTLFWNATSGHHIVRVVDDSGRSDSSQFTVSNIN
jgi:penicillin-binding protein 1C